MSSAFYRIGAVSAGGTHKGKKNTTSIKVVYLGLDFTLWLRPITKITGTNLISKLEKFPPIPV